jgi:hypothetical protein
MLVTLLYNGHAPRHMDMHRTHGQAPGHMDMRRDTWTCTEHMDILPDTWTFRRIPDRILRLLLWSCLTLSSFTLKTHV